MYTLFASICYIPPVRSPRCRVCYMPRAHHVLCILGAVIYGIDWLSGRIYAMQLFISRRLIHYQCAPTTAWSRKKCGSRGILMQIWASIKKSPSFGVCRVLNPTRGIVRTVLCGCNVGLDSFSKTRAVKARGVKEIEKMCCTWA